MTTLLMKTQLKLFVVFLDTLVNLAGQADLNGTYKTTTTLTWIMYNVVVETGVLVLTQQITVVNTVKISFLLVLVGFLQ